MKKNYLTPEAEIEKFNLGCIATEITSGNPGGGTGDSGEEIEF